MGRGRTGLPVGAPKNASLCSPPPSIVPPGQASLCPTVPAPASCDLFFLNGPGPSPPPSLSPHRALGGLYPSRVDPASPGSPAPWIPSAVVTGSLSCGWQPHPPPAPHAHFPPYCSSHIELLAVGQTGHVSSCPWDFAQAVPSGTLIHASPTSGSCPSNIRQSRLCGEATSQVPQRWLPESVPHCDFRVPDSPARQTLTGGSGRPLTLQAFMAVILPGRPDFSCPVLCPLSNQLRNIPTSGFW